MITYASITKTGDRMVNEDSVSTSAAGDSYLFALADGLGGHGLGEVASKFVTDTCADVFRAGGGLEECFLNSQNGLLEQQSQRGNHDELKTTLALLSIKENRVCWGHVGDSRIYRFTKNKLAARTLDHSVPQMLVMSGEIREKAIRHHEDRNRLLRVLGVEWENPKYALSDEVALQLADSFLLCSDGFWEWIVEKEMIRLLKASASPEQWLSLMEAKALKNGQGKDMDNYSAIAVFAR